MANALFWVNIIYSYYTGSIPIQVLYPTAVQSKGTPAFPHTKNKITIKQSNKIQNKIKQSISNTHRIFFQHFHHSFITSNILSHMCLNSFSICVLLLAYYTISIFCPIQLYPLIHQSNLKFFIPCIPFSNCFLPVFNFPQPSAVLTAPTQVSYQSRSTWSARATSSELSSALGAFHISFVHEEPSSFSYRHPRLTSPFVYNLTFITRSFRHLLCDNLSVPIDRDRCG